MPMTAQLELQTMKPLSRLPARWLGMRSRWERLTVGTQSGMPGLWRWFLAFEKMGMLASKNWVSAVYSD